MIIRRSLFKDSVIKFYKYIYTCKNVFVVREDGRRPDCLRTLLKKQYDPDIS